MLGEIFKALLITSLAGSCLAAVITALKPITKKIFGYAWHYYIWLAVLAVMILPVRFTLPQKADITPVAVQTVQNVQTAQTVQNTDNVIPAVQAEPKTDILGTSFVKRIIDNRLNIFAYLWLMGAVMLLLINLIGYIRLIIKMRKNSVVSACPQIADFTRRKVTARVWENTSSPFMVGIFKPVLVLPARELTEEQLNNILRHEMTHFKRHDILYKWLVSLVKCVHWFNPVVWYVSKQINTECEISCDMAVTLAMSKTQEMSYIDTVLALLPTGKTKQIPLTTQMASSKRVLKRRFEMIRNKRKTNKFVSALSAILAVVMLGTTVFASGVLSDLAADDYTIEITNNGEKIELTNKPFIENGEAYLPLRETIAKVCDYENTCQAPSNEILWNDGQIRIRITYEEYDPEIDNIHIYSNSYGIEIGKANLIDPAHPGPDDVADIEMANAPVLKNSVTYVPFSYMVNIFNFNGWQIHCCIYDKNGKLADISMDKPEDYADLVEKNGNNITTSSLDNDNNKLREYEKQKLPYGTAELLFRDFHRQDFENMKTYCTENCVNTFFEKTLDGYQVFGMKNASIRSMAYANGSSETSDKVFLEISLYHMEFEETSYAQNRSTVSSFYLILKRQSDGRYLIDEFATGL